MTSGEKLTPGLLGDLLEYNPHSGSLTWKPRSPDLFSCPHQSTEAVALTWNKRFAGRAAFTATNGNGYHHGAIFGQTISAHKVAWALHYGNWPTHGIDHINGDRLDNRIENLRDVPGAENSRNQSRRRTNTSGVTGVSWFPRTRKWVAMIKGDGKVRNLGYFHTIEEAAAARKVAECRYGFHPNHGRAVA